MSFLKEENTLSNKTKQKRDGKGIITHNRNEMMNTQLKYAMRHWAMAVSVITVGEGGSQTGATVTSALLFSLEPSIMLVSINRNSSTYRSIIKNNHFCINLLNANQRFVAERFSGIGNFRGQQRYEGAEWYRMVTGASALTNALASIDCEVHEVIERYSHALVLGCVMAVNTKEGISLVYCNTEYGQYGSKKRQM
ncbi:MAG: Flavin reductase family protein [Candidatus Tokpelaia sp. JSC188]|nr:MAG: Flavin reductase family protein [Candidatus Tokpelaia sp. JSC188]